MVGWHHRLSGHEFEPALGDTERQGGLACCRPWGRKESDTTEQLNINSDWKQGWLRPQGTTQPLMPGARSPDHHTKGDRCYLKPLKFGFYFVNGVLPLLMQNTPISITMKVKFLTLLNPLFTLEQIPGHHQASCVSTVCWMGSVPHPRMSHLRGRDGCL